MGNWQLDPYHTQIEFSAKHLGMMTVRGYFDEVSAVADIDPDHPEAASVEVTISTASIRTNNAHAGQRHPLVELPRGGRIPGHHLQEHERRAGRGGPLHADRRPDHQGHTHPVALDVTRYGEFNDAGMMGHRIAYGATTKINRKDFGLKFNAVLDGRLVVSEDIQITIEGELVEQQEAAETAG
jgi:polyisoprenoid-binding protein YceI